MNYRDISMVEYEANKIKVLNTLGRKSGICDRVSCDVCPLDTKNNGKHVGCLELECIYPLTAVKLIMEYKFPLDWNNVPVDTPILVSHDNIKWFNRHYSHLCDGLVCAFANGTTSWSATNTVTWEYAKLVGRELPWQ